MNKLFCLIFFCVVFIFFSCKRQKISLPPNTTEVNNFTIQEIDFTYFSSRSKINYKDSENNLNAIVNIRMKKDSVIWLSISKIGVEGARSLITKDSIYIIDKLKNEYTVSDFKTLSDKFNFTITFDFIQAAILGNLPFSQEKDKAKLVKAKDYYLLRQNENSVTIDNYISTEDMKLKKISMVEQPSNNSLTLDYEDFKMLNNVLFPYSSLVSLQYESSQGYYTTLVIVQHQKVEITEKELKFPFNLPQKYDRK